MAYKEYGHWSEDGKEYIITERKTPRHWYNYYFNDMYNAFSSGANVDMAMNALSSLIGESEAMAIRSKSLSYNYLTISEEVSSLLKVLMVGVFPLAYLGVGIIMIINRKKVHNETI